MSQPLYLIAGLGKTGLSIAHYLHRKNKPFIVFDTREDAPGLSELHSSFPGVSAYLSVIPDDVLRQVTDIIASPGLSLDCELIQHAKKLDIAVYGDIECLAREVKAPVVAITGTNGKSTVTSLVGEMAKAAGYNVAVAGNIGTPVLDRLDDEHHYDLWVLELSSFQLDLTFSLKPKAATILNISPDHLDRHHTVEAYTQAKQRVYHQTEMALYNREDNLTIPPRSENIQSMASFGKAKPNPGEWGLIRQGDSVYLAKGNETIFAVNSLRIKGVHNWLNALAACALAESVGIGLPYIIEVLSTFSGLSHRCQWVRNLEGVDWVDDSKGTNVGATISAINGIGGAMQGKIVLIAGGQGKGAQFHELAQPMAEFVRSVVLIGEDADKIEKDLAQAVPFTRANSMGEAVKKAKEQAKPGDVVLLSPACASFDMFRDYNHRGEVFAASVNGL